MLNVLRNFWREDRAPGARGPGRGDALLTAIVIAVAIAEGIWNASLTWPVFSVALTVALAFTLPWRRVRPLDMTVLAFAATGLAHTAGILAGIPWSGLDTNIVMLVLPYALLRWGSGREAVLGLGVVALSFAAAMWGGGHGWGEVLGASLFLLFPAALGASVRYQDAAGRRAREQVRLQERERLARELHDTVAHHVSAIAIQAQAGRALAGARPEAPAEALAVIEEAASRTLTEMRLMVSSLRDDTAAERAPAAGFDDLGGLAQHLPGEPEVAIELTGEVATVSTTLQTTVYRLAQEAVTNARRHARGATQIRVRVEVDRSTVRLGVVDDGVAAGAPTGAGFGVQGMRERTTMLGGRFHAGPGIDGGWRVEAELPRERGA